MMKVNTWSDICNMIPLMLFYLVEYSLTMMLKVMIIINTDRDLSG